MLCVSLAVTSGLGSMSVVYKMSAGGGRTLPPAAAACSTKDSLLQRGEALACVHSDHPLDGSICALTAPDLPQWPMLISGLFSLLMWSRN